MRGRTHQALRTHTQRLHETLDAGTSLPSLTRREGYVGLLLMNWPCVAIEKALEQAGVRELLPDWDLRRRRFDLTADLAALNVSLPASPSLEVAPDPAAILGWSYVLEGSRVGAKFILRSVEANASADILGATRFLMHGRGTDFWGSFQTALATIDDNPGAIATACDSACAAFECFLAAAADSQRTPVPAAGGI